jgi:protein-disulfide isomerase
VACAIAATVFCGTGQLSAASRYTSDQQDSTTASAQQVGSQILDELRVIRQLLERLAQPQAPTPQAPVVRLENLGGYALGRSDAPIAIVEFTDLHCPFCRQFALSTFGELRKNWIETGQVRYVTRDFPLEIHPHAMTAARAARCAGEQNRFWEMRFELIRNSTAFSLESVAKTAADLRLDGTAFASCVSSSRYDADIRSDRAEGTRVGVRGTPTFVLGKLTPVGIEGPMIVGAVPYVQIEAILTRLLESR